jgi:hypothetical protein
VLAIALCTAATHVFAQSSVDSITDVANDMFAYINTNSPVRRMAPYTKWLPTDDVGMPDITIVPAAELTERYRSYAYTSPDLHQDTDLTVGAFYNFENETMYFKDTIDVGSVYGRAVVLHELVHHVQYVNGITFATCDSYRMQERQAYSLQLEYMLSNGFSEDDSTIIGLKWNKVFFGRSCTNPHQ